MKLEVNPKLKLIRTKEVLHSREHTAFEFRPETEFDGTDVRAIVSNILELFKNEWSSAFRATYLTGCLFPGAIPELHEAVKAKVQDQRGELTRCLSDDLRRDNADKFFLAYLAELAVTLPDEPLTLQSAWEARGREAAKAKLEYVTFQKAWGARKGDFHWNGLAHHGLSLFDFPELREMVAKHLQQSKNTQGVSLEQAMERRIQQPFGDIFGVELRALRRVWLAYQGEMTSGMLPAGQVEHAYELFKSFKRVFSLQSLQVESMLEVARNLMLLTAPRLEFPDNGVVRPVWIQPLTERAPIPERLNV